MKNFYNLYITPALNILGSIKFAFFLIICLIILSMIGSIISDASIDKIKYNFIISLFFNPSTDEFKDFAFTFGLLNVYTSPLFITLLFLFTINLLICTFKLFPFAKKGFPFVDENGLKNEIVFKDDVSAVTDFFYKEGWRVSRSPENNNIVKAEHHKPGKYGVIITHFGIIFIMAGAFIGHYMGFSGSMLVFENQVLNEVEKQNGEKIHLNFAVKLNDFNIEFYEGSKTAKAFTSNISIIENNNEVKNVDINVNHPLKYKDVVFYQASYGQSPHNDMLMNVFISKDNKSETVDLKYNKAYDFDDYKIVVRDFYTDIGYNSQTGEYYNKSYNLANPALYLAVYDKEGKGLMGGWLPLYSKEPSYIEPLNISFQFNELKDVVYSGFSVKYNPGISIVYLGGIFLCFGVVFIYLLNYTAIIFTVSNGVLRYKVFAHRKLPLVNPAEKFYKHFNISKEK